MTSTCETRADATADLSHIYEQLKPLIADEQYALMLSHLLATGRGRRPTIPTIPFTNRLIAQLSLLRLDGKKTYEDIIKFADRYLSIKSGGGFPRLSTRIHNVMKQLQGTSFDNWENVLSTPLELKYIGPFCEMYDISHDSLLNACGSLTPVEVSNGLCLELLSFAKKLSLKDRILHGWLVQLCPSLKTCTNLKYRISTIHKHYNALLRCVSKSDVKMKIDIFLNERFFKEDQPLNKGSTSRTQVRDSCQDCEVLKQQLDLAKQEIAAFKKTIACMQKSKTSTSKMVTFETELQMLKEASINSKVDSVDQQC